MCSLGTMRDVIPAIQVMINCGTAGSCNGGDSNAANQWVYRNGGIPDVTCQQYQAKNMEVILLFADYTTSSCISIILLDSLFSFSVLL